jgi:hypothetical protein
MFLSSIFQAIKNIFKPQSFVPPTTSVTTDKGKKPRRRVRAGAWLEESLNGFDGTRPITVRVPRALDLRGAQVSLCRRLSEMYGRDRFKTHMNRERHTIRVLPK